MKWILQLFWFLLIFPALFLFPIVHADPTSCPDLYAEEEICARNHGECLAKIEDPNKVAACDSGYSSCTDWKTVSMAPNCTNFLVQQKELVKNSSKAKVDEKLGLMMKFFKEFLRPLIAFLSKDSVSEWKNLQGGLSELTTWFIRFMQKHQSKMDSVKNIFPEVDIYFWNVFKTGFEFWYGGFGGAIGKVFDRLSVVCFCPTSAVEISDIYAERGDCLDKNSTKYCDEIMFSSFEKLAKNSSLTCGLYIDSVKTSYALLGNPSNGLRDQPLTQLTVGNDKLYERTHRYDQDGVHALPESFGNIYEKCPDKQRKISNYYQNTQTRCKNDEDCELELAKRFLGIETDNPECSQILGQTTGADRFFAVIREEIKARPFVVYDWINELANFIYKYYLILQLFWKVREFITSDKKKPNATRTAANAAGPAEAANSDQDGPTGQNEPNDANTTGHGDLQTGDFNSNNSNQQATTETQDPKNDKPTDPMPPPENRDHDREESADNVTVGDRQDAPGSLDVVPSSSHVSITMEEGSSTTPESQPSTSDAPTSSEPAIPAADNNDPELIVEADTTDGAQWVPMIQSDPFPEVPELPRASPPDDGAEATENDSLLGQIP